MTIYPLDGVRVVDFTRDYAGAYVTLWLAAMGAEVIKIESAVNADVTRGMGVKGKADIVHPRSGYFNAANYSKLGCTINLREERAAELVQRLVMVSDIVAESYAGGVMERLGIGYATLRKVRPDLIYFSTCGFGRTGPNREYKAYGHVASSFGGIDLLTGFPAQPPVSVGSTLDGLTSMSGVFAILAAYWDRQKTGKGQHIDEAMSEVQMAMVPQAVMEYAFNGRLLERSGNRHEWMAPHGCYPCRDGEHIAIAVGSDQEWASLCHIMGQPELAIDPRFADPLERYRRQEEIELLLSGWTCLHQVDELTRTLQEGGVKAGPVNTIERLSADPHLQARRFFEPVEKAGRGRFTLPRIPGDVDETPQFKYVPAPDLGEHNERIFKDMLGMPQDTFEQLAKEEIIF